VSGVFNEIADEMQKGLTDVGHFLAGAPRVIASEARTLKAISDKAGWPTAARLFGAQAMADIGIPFSREIEADVSRDLALYQSQIPDRTLKQQLKDTFEKGFTAEEMKSMERGGINLATAMIPGKPFTALAKRVVPFSLLQKLAAAQMHSIAAMVAWETGQAHAEGEDMGEAALRGAALGAVVPPVFMGAGKLGGMGVKYGAKGVGKIAKPTLAAMDQAVLKSETYRNVRNFLSKMWDYGGHSGETILNLTGARATGEKMKLFRLKSQLMAARWWADAWLAMRGTNDTEKAVVTKLLHMTQEETAEMLQQYPQYAPLVKRAEKVATILREAGAGAEEVGIPIIDSESKTLRFFKMLPEYGMPHVIKDTEQYIVPGPMRDKALEAVMSKGKTLKEAEAILQSIHDHATAERETGGWGFSHMRGRRYGLPGYVDDPMTVLPNYFMAMAKRIQAMRHFGQQGGASNAEEITAGFAPPSWYGKERAEVKELFPKAFVETKNVADPTRKKLAEEIIGDQLGAWNKGNEIDHLARKVMQIQAITKLGLGQISQAAQIMMATVPSGYENAARDLFRAAGRDPEIHDRLLRTGSFFSNISRQAHADMMGGEIGQASRVLKGTGFTWMDTFARKYAALRGWSMANAAAEEYSTLANRLAKAGTIEGRFIERRMTKIGDRLTTMVGMPSGGKKRWLKNLVKQGGLLNPEELSAAGLKLSTDVNFWSDSLSLPHFYRSPWGRFFTQFKSFAYQQSKFMDQYVIKPALDGDLGPLTRAVPSLAFTGEVIADIKAFLRGKKRTDKGVKRLINNMATASSFGMLGDVFRATDYSGGLLSWAVGPSVSMVAEGGEAVGRSILAGHPTKQLGKFAVGLAAPYAPFRGVSYGPIVAPWIQQQLFGKKPKSTLLVKPKGVPKAP
jgi:hypothetical protein